MAGIVAAAKAELLRENPSNSLFNQIFAEVYIGLKDKESLRLASHHNNNGHLVHIYIYICLWLLRSSLAELCYIA